MLNERLFDDGANRVRVPLLSAVAASNEGPESDELAALYDRFLLRRLVAPVSDDGILELLLGSGDRTLGSGDRTLGSGDRTLGSGDRTLGSGGEEASGDADGASTDVDTALPDLREALETVRAAAPAVHLPRHVALLLRDARAFVRDVGVDGLGGGYVSDRRLRRSAELLKACAAAHGRDVVSVVDAAAVLPHVLWETAEEAAALAEWVEDHAVPEGGAEQLQYLLESVRSRAALAAEADAGADVEAGTGADAGADATAAAASGGGGDASLAEDAVALAAATLEAAAEMRRHVRAIERAAEHLFLPAAQAAGLRQRLLPRARESAEELEELAAEAALVELALADGLDKAVWAALQAEDELDEEGGDEAGTATAAAKFTFDEEELSWGRKEAKAKLGPEEFKAWRKAAKAAAKRGG